MTYKGYAAEISIDEEAGILFGTIAGIHDVLTFQGETIAEFMQAFHDSVDDCLEWCAERGEEPQVPQDAAARAS
jgi:predicted HicB family RNase H-like nuclease